MKVNILLANFAILNFPTQNYFSYRVCLESIETGAEKVKGAAQRRSSILPGRENVETMERGQLSSDHAQFPCHFPAKNFQPIIRYFNCIAEKKRNRKVNIAP